MTEMDPRNKAVTDALYEVTARAQARRNSAIWTCVALASVASMLLWYVEALPASLKNVALIAGALVFFVYLAWLSTTDFGRFLAEFLRRWLR